MSKAPTPPNARALSFQWCEYIESLEDRIAALEAEMRVTHDNATWNEAIEAAADQARKIGLVEKARLIGGTDNINCRELSAAASNSCYLASEAILDLKREAANV